MLNVLSICCQFLTVRIRTIIINDKCQCFFIWSYWNRKKILVTICCEHISLALVVQSTHTYKLNISGNLAIMSRPSKELPFQEKWNTIVLALRNLIYNFNLIQQEVQLESHLNCQHSRYHINSNLDFASNECKRLAQSNQQLFQTIEYQNESLFFKTTAITPHFL